MVSSRHDSETSQIILRPNRSADWRANRTLLLSLTVVSCVIGGGFAAAGAWMVLPFAGLELLAAGAALYWVSWKLAYQQVITFADAALSIDKGVYRPRHSWRFERSRTSVAVRGARSPHDARRISLCSDGEDVRIGEFLSREEGEDLLRALRESGLRVRDHGHDESFGF